MLSKKEHALHNELKTHVKTKCKNDSVFTYFLKYFLFFLFAQSG